MTRMHSTPIRAIAVSTKRLATRLIKSLRGVRSDPSPPRRTVDVRVASNLFARVREHVEDFSRGEEAGFLLCALSRLADRDVLLAREWLPVPDRVISRNGDGSVLSWSAEFNSEVLTRCLEEDMTMILVHSHGGRARPRFSADDRRNERALFGPMSRLLGDRTAGTMLLGRGDAIASFWCEGACDGDLDRLVIVGQPVLTWYGPEGPANLPTRQRLVRQNGAIGHATDAQLASAKVAVLGISGGGSHVVQQLSHQGVGGLICVDDELIEETNLGRVVGAVTDDIDVTAKTDLARRVAHGVDPDIDVTEIRERFPSAAGIKALREADVVVACVDRFDARAAINSFCRRYMIPMVDVGMSMRTSGAALAQADGQVIVSVPDSPCLRCWFVSDAVLAAEQRNRPAGYDRNRSATGDPQVISMNGVLASEACNVVLDLITGFSNGSRQGVFWQYDGRTGTLLPEDLPSSRSDCPACAEAAYGDPVVSDLPY